MINRSQNMQNFLDKFTEEVVGTTQAKAEEKKLCVWCSKPIKDFKDEISFREYKISGLCQDCQDESF